MCIRDRDVAQFARRQGIRYAGRGSAADSLVSYCLFICDVDALQRGLLFERFMSPERSQLPDIDIDFEARYRDRVIDYVYKKYGTERVARVSTYNTFRARSAVRDVGLSLIHISPVMFMASTSDIPSCLLYTSFHFPLISNKNCSFIV